MGISLRDRQDHEHWCDFNFWTWRPIVEMIRSLQLLPDEHVGSTAPLSTSRSRFCRTLFTCGDIATSRPHWPTVALPFW